MLTAKEIDSRLSTIRSTQIGYNMYGNNKIFVEKLKDYLQGAEGKLVYSLVEADVKRKNKGKEASAGHFRLNVVPLSSLTSVSQFHFKGERRSYSDGSELRVTQSTAFNVVSVKDGVVPAPVVHRKRPHEVEFRLRCARWCALVEKKKHTFHNNHANLLLVADELQELKSFTRANMTIVNGKVVGENAPNCNVLTWTLNPGRTRNRPEEEEDAKRSVRFEMTDEEREEEEERQEARRRAAEEEDIDEIEFENAQVKSTYYSQLEDERAGRKFAHSGLMATAKETGKSSSKVFTAKTYPQGMELNIGRKFSQKWGKGLRVLRPGAIEHKNYRSVVNSGSSRRGGNALGPRDVDAVKAFKFLEMERVMCMADRPIFNGLDKYIEVCAIGRDETEEKEEKELVEEKSPEPSHPVVVIDLLPDPIVGSVAVRPPFIAPKPYFVPNRGTADTSYSGRVQGYDCRNVILHPPSVAENYDVRCDPEYDSVNERRLVVYEPHYPEMPGVDQNLNWDYGPFVVAKHPGVRTLHDSWDVRGKPYDCLGSPYCGYVAIRVAMGLAVKVSDFKDFADGPDDGTVSSLGKYAQCLGVNLVVEVLGGKHGDTGKPDPLVRSSQANLGEDDGIVVFEHSPAFNWVKLVLYDCHYYLVIVGEDNICKHGEKDVLDTITGVQPVNVPFLHMEWFEYNDNICRRYWHPRREFSVGKLIIQDLSDQRALCERRDTFKYVDGLCRVNMKETRDLRIWIKVGVVASVLIIVVLWFWDGTFLGLSCVLPIIVFALVRAFYDRVYREVEFVVSVERFLEAVNQINSCVTVGSSPDMAVNRVFRDSDTRTPLLAYGHNVLMDTANLLNIYKLDVKPGVYDRNPVRVMNSPGDEIYIKNLDVILDNQEKGMAGYGDMKNPHNYVVKLPAHLPPPKKNVVVAVAPGGPLRSSMGEVGPGLVSCTDTQGVLSAFCVRSMTKKVETNDIRSEFVEAAGGYFDEFIATSELDHDEPDVIEAYRKLNVGKLSMKAVEANVQLYMKHKAGDASRTESKKVTRCSAFNKSESNVKRVGEKGTENKARLIMTMSIEMAIELAPVMDLIHAFNDSTFRQYQVKNCSPEEMCAKVERVTSVPHIITDYESYESSLTGDYRSIEVGILLKLCGKFNYKRTAEAVRKYYVDGRYLERKGLKLYIGSRCSGDYSTSFGNGVFSYASMRFCSEKKGIGKFEGLFEGDDGIVPADVPDLDIIKALGLSFSCQLSGTKPGDCDFLSSRFMDGRRYLNIAKYVNSFLWVKTNGKMLGNKKVLWIWRCMGASLYHLSPGHPVLTALVNHIGHVTAGFSAFKGYEKFLDPRKFPGFNTRFPRGPGGGDVLVDESMRYNVSIGSQDFTPISLSDQYILERSLRKGEFAIGDIFHKDDGMRDLALAYDRGLGNADNFKKLFDAIRSVRK